MDHNARLFHRQGGVTVWHPEDLAVDALLESFGQRVGEGLLWLGHCVYTGLANNAGCRETGRVPLKTEYLRNVIGRHHLDGVREAARQIGYVGRDPSYRAGIRSQTYFLSPPYDQARLVQRPIVNPALRHNIHTWRESRHREIWQRIKRGETLVDVAVCTHLWRNIQRVQIDRRIDFGEAFHPAYQMAVEHIRRQELWFIVDGYGRIHTNLTNHPKTLRRYLSVEGVRLANVDISESQPLFIGMALAVNNGRRKEGRKGARQTDGSRGGPFHMMDNTIMDKSPQLDGDFDRRRLPTDLCRYLEVCEARGLYQAVADRLGKTREEAKKSIMVVFFDKPWHRNAVSAVLDQLFPSVMEAMRGIKRQDYRRLAHLAQRIESAFMFGRVVPRIMQLRPELFVATIHDSIQTTAGDASFVRQVMLDEFAKLGLSPQVKVERVPRCRAECKRRAD